MSVRIESWRQGDSWRFLREEQHNKSKEHGFGQHRGRNPDYDSMCWSFGVCLPWTSSDLRKAKNKQKIDIHYSILERIQKYLGANFFFFNLSSKMNDLFSPRNSKYFTPLSHSCHISELLCSLSDKGKASQRRPVSCSRSQQWVSGRAGFLTEVCHTAQSPC